MFRAEPDATTLEAHVRVMGHIYTVVERMYDYQNRLGENVDPPKFPDNLLEMDKFRGDF